MKYGPQTEQIELLIERARWLTASEAKGLATLWSARVAEWAANTAVSVARTAAWDARTGAGLAAEWAAAWDLAAVWVARAAAWSANRAAVSDVARFAAQAAAWDAGLALATRHLVGVGGYTVECYDILSAPWRLAVDFVHPDDQLDVREIPLASAMGSCTSKGGWQ